MKKNNIFRHELNESSQAKATLNCLTNRNKKHLKESIGEVYPDFCIKGRIGLCESIPTFSGKTYNGGIDVDEDGNLYAFGGYDDDEFVNVPYLNKFDNIHKDAVDVLNRTFWTWFYDSDNYVEDIDQYTDDNVGTAIEKVLDATDDFPSNSTNSCYRWFKKHGDEVLDNLIWSEKEQHLSKHPQFIFEQEEQEEFENDFESEPQISAKNVFDVKFKHSPLKNSVSPMVKHAWGIIYNKYGDGLDRAIYMGGADDSEILEVFKSYEEYSKDAHDLVSKLLGHKRINEEEELTAEQEETTPPWVFRKYNGGIDFDADGNLQVITPDEDDDDDDYEAPPLFDSEQERHDIALATTYCLGESFIDNDGDLDDIYYAVLKVFDSTYDAPATTDYEDVLQWCRKYYKQIESMIN